MHIPTYEQGRLSEPGRATNTAGTTSRIEAAQCKPQTALREERQRLQVLVWCEDRSAGLRACQALGEVVRRLDWLADFTVDVREFDLRSASDGLPPRTGEPAEADIVFVATHGASELPPAVSWWLSQWLAPKEDQPRALVLSLDASVEHTPQVRRVRETLQGVARLANVDLFLHLADGMSRESEFVREDLVHAAAIPVGASAQLFQPPGVHAYREWGINE